MDIRQGKHVPRDGYTIPTEHAEPVGVSRNHTVFDIATRQIADERTDAAARAPYCARAPAIDNRRVRMSEPSDEAAVVAAVGSYVAARRAVGDCARRVVIADKATNVAVAANKSICATVDDCYRRLRAAINAGADKAAGVGASRRDLDRRRAIADGRAAIGTSYKAANIFFPCDRSRNRDPFYYCVARAAEESTIAIPRWIVRADEVADGVPLPIEPASERRRASPMGVQSAPPRSMSSSSLYEPARSVEMAARPARLVMMIGSAKRMKSSALVVADSSMIANTGEIFMA